MQCHEFSIIAGLSVKSLANALECPNWSERYFKDKTKIVVKTWSQGWKLNLNAGKIEVYPFSTWSNNSSWNPTIFIGNQKVRVNTTPRLLGVILDRILTFNTHLRKITVSLASSIRIIRATAHTSWSWRCSTLKKKQLPWNEEEKSSMRKKQLPWNLHYPGHSPIPTTIQSPYFSAQTVLVWSPHLISSSNILHPQFHPFHFVVILYPVDQWPFCHFR